MPEVWTITGEDGKAVDATARTLPQMQAEGCIVNFASLAEDTLSWEIWLDQVADATGLVPDIGQIITLWRDSTRYFRGHVTERTPRFSSGRMGYAITVSGPWYFLANTSISSEVPDQTTVARERAVYLFDTGSPRDHLISLVSRAIALGMPISMGSIATVFDVPRLSLREMSFAEAISEIMRWVADGLVYFDYSAPTGHPALCMQRRDTASTITLDPALIAVPELSVRPRHDLQIEELEIYYARRVTDGSQRLTAYESQSAGAASGPLPARQIITSTGPEMDTYVPQDLTDFVEVQSELFNIGKALSRDHDILRSAQANVSVATAQFADVYSTGSATILSGGGFVTTYYWPKNILVKITDRDGNPIDLGEWQYMLTLGEVRNWWEKDGIEFKEARVTASVYEASLDAASDWYPEWAKLMGAQRQGHTFNGGVRRWVEATVSTTVTLVKTLWSAPTILIRSEDWGWFNPPAGLAENLLSTQDWLPYEGTIPCATDTIPAGNAVGSGLNISGWVAETAAMRALISGYSVRPATGQLVYQLGPPARHAYRDLVNRFRQSGADNIYWISGQAATSPWPVEPGLPEAALVFTGQGLSYLTEPLTYTP